MKKKKISKAERNFFALLSFFSPRINTELLFFKKFGRLPDLKNPVTLNEKLLKLKLEEYRDSELVRKCADKYRVREYVRERGLESCLNAIEAVYDRAEDIDWDALPHSFAMKWNFGCSYNIICRSKDQLDKKAAKRQMEKWGREPFWAYYSELQYRGVDKKIIVEEYIGSPEGLPPEDYKFYCFHGHAHCVMVCAGREEGWPRFYFLTGNFSLCASTTTGKKRRMIFLFQNPRGLRRLLR